MRIFTILLVVLLINPAKSNADAIVHLPNGQKIRLEGVNPEDLSADNFIFADPQDDSNKNKSESVTIKSKGVKVESKRQVNKND